MPTEKLDEKEKIRHDWQKQVNCGGDWITLKTKTFRYSIASAEVQTFYKLPNEIILIFLSVCVCVILQLLLKYEETKFFQGQHQSLQQQKDMNLQSLWNQVSPELQSDTRTNRAEGLFVL